MRFGTQRIIAVAFAFFVAGYALFLRIDADPTYAWVILPSMLLIGTGFALAFPSLNIQATAGVANDEQGLASGLLNTSVQIGGAVGLAVVAAVVTTQTGSGTSSAALLDGFHPGLAVVTILASLGFLASLSGVAAERVELATEPASG
jgi:predicted MFS family arabinose efflux permease